MWVLYFAGRPTYWLLSGATYHFGRKECEIVILDDASISRVHLDLEVRLPLSTDEIEVDEEQHGGVAAVATTPTPSVARAGVRPASRRPRPPPVVLTDRSKYGSHVILLGTQLSAQDPIEKTQVALTKDVAYFPPSADCSLSIVLGTHGTRFDLKWEPVTFFLPRDDGEGGGAAQLLGFTKDDVFKLGLGIMTCGGLLSRKSTLPADAVVANCIGATTSIVEILCAAKPIVSPTYLDECKSRMHCKIPPPDIAQLKFTPRNIDPFWIDLFSQSADDDADKSAQKTRQHHHLIGSAHTFPNLASRASGVDVTLDCSGRNKDHEDVDARRAFLPHAERPFLFSAVTFVTLQRSLHDETAAFVPLSQGKVVFDDTLVGVTAEKLSRLSAADKRCIELFFTRHHQHVVLYTDNDILPMRECMTLLRSKLQMQVIEYRTLLRHILKVKKLVLQHPPLHSLKPLMSSLQDASKPSPVKQYQDVSEEPPARRTVRNVFPDGDDEDDGGGIHQHRDPSGKANNKRPRDDGGIASWRSRDASFFLATDSEQQGRSLQIGHTSVSEAVCGDDDDVDDERKGTGNGAGSRAGIVTEDLLLHRAVISDAYPCWRPYAASSGRASAGGKTKVPVTSSSSLLKPFKKQYVPKPEGGAIQMETVVRRDNAIAFPAADDDDIIPQAVEDPRRGMFNAFDAKSHHGTAARKAATTARIAPVTAAALKRAAQPRRATAAPVNSHDVGNMSPPSQPPGRSAGASAGGGAARSIFDFDNLY